ncbi:hypothetical protein G3480_24875 [Thiorhodococcus mannitoliphagus]|uniref:Uncharacterized protein n=1 Tax=Thiorhodococcus mannitoliphagus TaxID=329406 RepID=A0A6P1E2Q5_9GAMM|nr:hypothetical protein [Thiorhodococcus mannitoliphagus]NEX23483.1 hypothetical protein [Thiorhodococcus mannitoliphagus]
MHADLTPLAPWSEANGWLGVVSGETLTVGCLLSGLLGLLTWLVLAWRRGQRPPVSSRSVE